MTRTRLVKGTITERTGGNEIYYAEGNIVINAVKSINITTVDGISFGEPENPPLPEIKSKVIVEFRPNSNWKGEYGFDWIRLGDTGLKGDVWYKKIIGNYRDSSNNLEQIYTGGTFKQDIKKYDKLLTTFKNNVIPWKGKIQGNLYLYPIPVMTILKGEKHTLTLRCEVEEKPKKIIIKQKITLGSSKEYFKLNITSIPIKNKKYILENYLEITCLESFKNDQFLEVYADDEICGTLKILANDVSIQKKAKVVFISVKTANGSGSVSGEKERLQKYMKQAYINLDVKSLNLDLTSDKNFIKELKSDTQTHKYLDKKLRNAKLPDGKILGKKYDSYYRVYFINEIIQQSSGGYLLGQAEDIPSKAVYVLNLSGTAKKAGVSIKAVDTTATHELLHAIGLAHTFDNDSLFTFKKFNTDNIMDYYSLSTDIKAVQIYKWQWELLRSKLT